MFSIYLVITIFVEVIMVADDVAKIFKALCDPKRVAIIEMLKQEERCACKLSESLDIAQSKLSYHMKILCESGLIKCWYVGKWTHYSINKEACERAINILRALTLGN